MTKRLNHTISPPFLTSWKSLDLCDVSEAQSREASGGLPQLCVICEIQSYILTVVPVHSSEIHVAPVPRHPETKRCQVQLSKVCRDC
jgi:hypothetical protein